MKGIDEHLENLKQEWQTISTKLYQQTEETPKNGDDKQNETTDVEYEEVN